MFWQYFATCIAREMLCLCDIQNLHIGICDCPLKRTGKSLEKYVVLVCVASFYYLHLSHLWYKYRSKIVQCTEYIYYIICKVTISLSLFRYTFVHSIRSVCFLWTDVSGTHTRKHILSHWVINRTVAYKEKNDCVTLSITIADWRRS